MIIHGDSLTELKKLPDNSVDCVITSPPYNLTGVRGGTDLSTQDSRKLLWNRVSVKYDQFDDNLPEDVYEAQQVEMLNQCYRIIKPTGSIFYNHKHRMWQRKGYHFWDIVSKSDCQFYQEIVWNRKNTPAIDKRMLFPMTERIVWLCKGKPNVYKNEVDKEFRKDIWDISPNADKTHPASFPIQLPINCIKLTTQPGQVVLDPYAGSFTVGCACLKLNREFIGIELSQNYIDIGKKRMEDASHQ